jgi:hypothetical protein
MMAGMRIAALILAVVTLVLPPRWCCAIPGIPSECCDACKAQAEAGESCCACADGGNSKGNANRQEQRVPCECMCHDPLAQLAKGPDLDHALPIAMGYTLPGLQPSPASGPCCLMAQALPPHDVQSQLCRWLI